MIEHSKCTGWWFDYIDLNPNTPVLPPDGTIRLSVDLSGQVKAVDSQGRNAIPVTVLPNFIDGGTFS